MHKPIANRLMEAAPRDRHRARHRRATHFMPWDSNGSMEQVMAWIKDGSIGTLREVHNWTNRPVWPQYRDHPDRHAARAGGLRLGPLARPRSATAPIIPTTPTWSSAAGTISAAAPWRTWATTASGPSSTRSNSPAPPASIRCSATTACSTDGVSTTLQERFLLPRPPASCASTIRRAASAAAVDLIWYEGGMRPPTPEELDEDHKELPAEGMMFVGDKGKILAGFRVESPRLIPEKQMSGNPPPRAPPRAPARARRAFRRHAAVDRGLQRRQPSRPAAS